MQVARLVNVMSVPLRDRDLFRLQERSPQLAGSVWNRENGVVGFFPRGGLFGCRRRKSSGSGRIGGEGKSDKSRLRQGGSRCERVPQKCQRTRSCLEPKGCNDVHLPEQSADEEFVRSARQGGHRNGSVRGKQERKVRMRRPPCRPPEVPPWGEGRTSSQPLCVRIRRKKAGNASESTSEK